MLRLSATRVSVVECTDPFAEFGATDGGDLVNHQSAGRGKAIVRARLKR